MGIGQAKECFPLFIFALRKAESIFRIYADSKQEKKGGIAGFTAQVLSLTSERQIKSQVIF